LIFFWVNGAPLSASCFSLNRHDGAHPQMTLGVVANPIDLVVPRPHRFHTIFHNTWGGMEKKLERKKYHSGIFSGATVFAINYQVT